MAGRIMPKTPSDLIHENSIDLFVLYAQIAHSHSRGGVVEPPAQNLKAYAILHPLDIAESLAQGMGAIVAPKIDLSTP